MTKHDPTMKMKVKVTQSCLTLCDPMDCSLPGSSVCEILQARVLEWVAISFSMYHVFRFHILSDIIWYLSFSWLTSPSVISAAENGGFILFCGWVIFYYAHTHTPPLLYPSVSGHLSYFHVLIIVHSAAMNTGVHLSFWIWVFSRYMLRNGTAGWYGTCF